MNVSELPDPRIEPVISVERAGRIVGLGRTASYESVRTGVLPSIRLSARRTVVPTAQMWRLLGVPIPGDDRGSTFAGATLVEVEL